MAVPVSSIFAHGLPDGSLQNNAAPICGDSVPEDQANLPVHDCQSGLLDSTVEMLPPNLQMVYSLLCGLGLEILQPEPSSPSLKFLL